MKFVIRAVNHAQKDFVVTYIAVRLLLDQISRDKTAHFFEQAIERGTARHTFNRYRNYNLFKSVLSDGNIQYRSCSAASPMALMSESYSLEQLLRDRTFQPPSSVFSYLPPRANSPHAFAHFYDGYKRRQLAISDALKHTKLVAVLVDFTDFYPTVDVSAAVNCVDEVLDGANLSDKAKKVVRALGSQYANTSRRGLPVGPPFAHFLANQALKQLDDILCNRYPKRYFRYVDDIAVVVEPRDVEDTLAFLTSTADRFGYKLNGNKTKIVGQADFIPLPESKGLYDLQILKLAISLYSAISEKNINHLETELRNAGINLPISWFRRASQSTGWQKFAIRSIRSLKRPEFLQAATLALGERGNITAFAERLRGQLRRELSSALERNQGAFSRHSTALFKSLLMFFPVRELGLMTALLTDENGLRPLRCLIDACVSGNASELLWYPGQIVSLFIQLWGVGNRVEIGELRSKVSPPQRDSLAALQVAGLVMGAAESFHGADSDILRFASGSGVKRRFCDDFSYDDEVTSLLVGRQSASFEQYLNSRYDASESNELETLFGSGLNYYA